MNKLVLLRKGNVIISVLGVFRTHQLAIWFIYDNYSEFSKDICQFSEFKSDKFITIEDV